MKRSSGAIALLFLLFTGARFATLHPSTSATTGVESRIQQAAEVTPRDEHVEETTCEAFADPTPTEAASKDGSGKGKITSLVERYLYGLPKQAQMTEHVLPDDIRFMIVTVPDPLHTHLGLQFDRTLEALQQALQDEKYTYDSSWLPWKKQSSTYDNLGDQSRAAEDTARRELCPGLILFRRNMTVTDSPERNPYEHGIFVFVVAENPTSGLNQHQWLNALAWMDKYSRTERPDKALRILGPTFSGSMPSFARDLAALQPGHSAFADVLLYSGRIRGCGSWGWLKKQLNRSPGQLPVRVSDFDENDAIQIDRFFRFVSNRGHSLSEVAVLSEDETAYGGLPDATTGISAPPPCEPMYPSNNRPVHLYYPRDISAIRSAYQEQSIFPTGTSGENGAAPHTVLQPQADASSQAQIDTIEPFSGQGMALTQEAQLYGIVNSLRTHGIRYLVLRSTNSLDYLFLTRFFKRAYPDAYIVTMGTDMLFGREIDSTEFRGVIALSTFPLLPRGQDWTQQTASLPQHAHRVFGSDIMEGAYLAARFLTTDAEIKDRGSKADLNDYVHATQPANVDIPDYAEPFWDDHPRQTRASTWLAVIGRDGYWPIAILKEPYGKLPNTNLTSVGRPEVTDNKESSIGQFTLSSAWRFACFLAALVICVHFVGCNFGWQRQDLGSFIQFTPLPGRRQLALMAFGWSVVCSLLFLLLLASAPLFPWLRWVDRIWVLLMGLFALAGVVAVVLNMGRWPRIKKDEYSASFPAAQTSLKPWIVLTLVVVAVAAVLQMGIFDYFVPDGVITAYRSVHFTSGISPVVSLLFMLGGFYWWFWQTLCGLALLGEGRPILPGRYRIHASLSRVSSEMAEDIERSAVPFPEFRGYGKFFYLAPLGLLALEACVLQRPWSHGFDSILHSLENRSLNGTLHCMFALALFLLMIECAQLMATWFSLKRLLLALDRLPLRRTFSGLQGLSMRSLWTMSGTSSRARFGIFSHQLESLNHLRNELEAFDSRGSDPEMRRVIQTTFRYGLRFVRKRSNKPEADLAMVNDRQALALRRCFSYCTEKVIQHLLLPRWLEERTSLNVSEGASAEDAKIRLPLSDDPVVKLAEEFVCMVYVGYLQNMIARMRTMVLSIVGVYAAVALAIGCYPYSPRPLLALALMLLLMLLGSVVAIVYAGLDRDNTLSHITNTEPGTLGWNFWVRIISFVGVPAFGLVVAQFPEIADFVASWIQPSMNAVK